MILRRLTEAEVRSALQQLGLKAACYIDFVPSPAMGDAEAGARVKVHIRKGLERTEALWRCRSICLRRYADAIQGVPRRDVADALAGGSGLYSATGRAERHLRCDRGCAGYHLPVMRSAEEVLYLLRKVPGLRHVFDTGNMLAAGEDPVGFTSKQGLSHACPPEGHALHGRGADARIRQGGSLRRRAKNGRSAARRRGG